MKVLLTDLIDYLICPARVIYNYTSLDKKSATKLPEMYDIFLNRTIKWSYANFLCNKLSWVGLVEYWQDCWSKDVLLINRASYYISKGLLFLRCFYDHYSTREFLFVNFPFDLVVDSYIVHGNIDAVTATNKKEVQLVFNTRLSNSGGAQKGHDMVSFLYSKGFLASGFYDDNLSIQEELPNIRKNTISTLLRSRNTWTSVKPQLINLLKSFTENLFYLREGKHCTSCIYLKDCCSSALNKGIKRWRISKSKMG